MIIETPMREKTYVPNTYLASSSIINKTSSYGTQYRIKIEIPMAQDSIDTIDIIKKELESVRPELVEDPMIFRRGTQGEYSLYEVVVTLLNVRKINYARTGEGFYREEMAGIKSIYLDLNIS